MDAQGFANGTLFQTHDDFLDSCAMCVEDLLTAKKVLHKRMKRMKLIIALIEGSKHG
jgi:hypothetical protein